MLDVIEVVLDALFDAGLPAQSMDLRPTRHPRFHHMAQLIPRNVAAEIIDEDGPLGSRSDEAHVAGEHVEELRQLVDARPAQEGADSSDARIGWLREARAFLFGAVAHRAKLQ